MMKATLLQHKGTSPSEQHAQEPVWPELAALAAHLSVGE